MKVQEKELENLCRSAIKSKLQTTLLMLINNCYELSSAEYGSLSPNFENLPEIKAIEHDLFSLVANLESAIKKPDPDDALLESIENLKSRIINLALSAFFYRENAEILLTILSYESSEIPIDAELPSDIEQTLSDFLLNCRDYISGFDIPPEEKDEKDVQAQLIKRGAQILKFVPLKMTKEKYHDYLRSLSNILFGHLEDEEEIHEGLSLLKFLYRPSLPEDSELKDFYLDYHNTVEELYSEDFSVKSASEIEETRETLLIIKEDTTATLDYLSIFYESATFAKMLLLISEDLEDIFDDSILYKDFYYSLKENILTNELELYHEASKDSLSDAIERLIDLSRAAAIKFLKKASVADASNFSEDLNLLIQTLLLADSFYNDDLTSCLPPVHPGEINAKDASEDLITYIKTAESKFSAKRQKELRQLFLSKLPCPMKATELLDYMEYALSSLSEEKLRSCILHTYNELDISPDDFTDNYYDDDCDSDCEHDHNHHHH